MKREAIEDDYMDADVWINCTNDRLGNKVMDKGVILDNDWWEAKIRKGKHIHKKKIIL